MPAPIKTAMPAQIKPTTQGKVVDGDFSSEGASGAIITGVWPSASVALDGSRLLFGDSYWQ
jgi:hypothetical protein